MIQFLIRIIVLGNLRSVKVHNPGSEDSLYWTYLRIYLCKTKSVPDIARAIGFTSCCFFFFFSLNNFVL